MKMSKYEVVATVWNDELHNAVKTVVGEFDSWVCAKLFKDAYNAHYSSDAEIVEYNRK